MFIFGLFLVIEKSTNMKDDSFTREIINAAFEVHNILGSGYYERVYENALKLELEMRGFKVEQQVLIPVFYKGHQIGEYRADLLINDQLIIELKAIENLTKANEVQLVHYLTGTKIDIGLLINFGSKSVQVKRKYRTYRPSKK